MTRQFQVSCRKPFLISCRQSQGYDYFLRPLVYELHVRLCTNSTSKVMLQLLRLGSSDSPTFNRLMRSCKARIPSKISLNMESRDVSSSCVPSNAVPVAALSRFISRSTSSLMTSASSRFLPRDVTGSAKLSCCSCIAVYTLSGLNKLRRMKLTKVFVDALLDYLLDRRVRMRRTCARNVCFHLVVCVTSWRLFHQKGRYAVLQCIDSPIRMTRY